MTSPINEPQLRAILLDYRSMIASVLNDGHDRGITTEQLEAVDNKALAAIIALVEGSEG